MIKDPTVNWAYFNNKSGIYKITNIVNNKMYIGLTGNFVTRYSTHKYELKYSNEHNPHLRNSYAKYGEHKYIYSPIIVCEKKDLERYEIELIKLYRTQDRRYGYNVTPGGNRICGKNHHMFGKKQSAKWFAAIKARMTGKNNPFYKTGPRAAMAASKIKCSMPVVQLDKQGNFIKRFDSISDAAKSINISKHNIARTCKGFQNIGKYIVKRYTAGGYMWRYENKKAGIPVGG